jgi:hypothetical protein
MEGSVPRSILNIQSQSGSKSNLKTTVTQKPGLAGAKLEQRLRHLRSKTYVEAMKRLDAGTHEQDRIALDDLIQTVASEFPELTIDQRPLGIVSVCYLGQPYVVHVCDLSGNIIEHYESYKAMPALFERARPLALNAAYALIEVYADRLRAIAADGSVAVIDK